MVKSKSQKCRKVNLPPFWNMIHLNLSSTTSSPNGNVPPSRHHLTDHCKYNVISGSTITGQNENNEGVMTSVTKICSRGKKGNHNTDIENQNKLLHGALTRALQYFFTFLFWIFNYLTESFQWLVSNRVQYIGKKIGT